MYKKSYTEMSVLTGPEIARHCRQNKSWKYSTGISHGALLIVISNEINKNDTCCILVTFRTRCQVICLIIV